jgi:peptide/nickel transport system ATP-binding protein
MTSPAVTLEVEDLRTHFFTKAGVVKAVDGIGFEVCAGEVLGLVGESGCGKSITGFSIIGLIDPPGRVVSGAIRFKGQDLTRLDDEALRVLRGNRIAMIFQDPMMTLNPVLRVDTQMIEAISAHRAIDRKAALGLARDALAAVGIPSPERRLLAYPHELSGGMRQRVAIARALAQEAEVLLMDEPFGALDAMTRDVLHDELEAIWSRSAMTVLFVTHDVREAVRLGDRVVLLSSRPGRVVAEFAVAIPRPRQGDSLAVAGTAAAITERLREEVRRHGR